MCGSFQKTVSNPCDSHIARHERDDSLALQTKSICQRTGRKQQIRTVRSELPSNPLGLPMMLSGTNSMERQKTEQQSKQITEYESDDACRFWKTNSRALYFSKIIAHLYFGTNTTIIHTRDMFTTCALSIFFQ